jgi:hypothetical protein
MQNAYGIIILLFILGGIVTAAWGWVILRRARQRALWPQIDGVISASETAADEDDLLPRITYTYTVAGTTYTQTLAFPAGTAPSQELSRQYREKFPAGARVSVYHHPRDPQQATLEPGGASGDWLVLAFGLCAVVLGVVMLLIA